MKKTAIALLIMILTIGALPLSAIGQEASGISEYLDETLSAMVNKKQVKGAVVSVIRDGKTELCEGYGFADEEKGIAAHGENTAFRIGSVSKTFVAVAAEQLVQQGKLDMDVSVSGYLDADFPKFKYDITMHDLLTHTAGFEDMISGIAVYDINDAEPLAVSIRKYMPVQVFVPGEVVSYSNYGIALAAYVVERITGEAFFKYADENIFKPLDMTKTSFRLDFKEVAISKAYTANGKETAEPLINLYPEGSVVSTAADMTRYMQWLMDSGNEVLTGEGKKQLFDRQFSMSDEFQGMGYTWNRRERSGVVYYDKKGETANFYSRIAIYPEQKTGVFLSFNTYVNEEKLNALMDEITSLLLGPEKQLHLYTGEQTSDISGYYIATRSSFESPERVMNFLTPNQVFRISGSLSGGFKMNGRRLLPIGENYYSTPIGSLKFIKRSGRAYLANETAISYIRTNWYESSHVQILIFGLFIATSLTMAVIGVIGLFRSKARKTSFFIQELSFINLVLLAAICFLVLWGFSRFNILSLTVFIRICGMLIGITALSGASYTAHLLVKRLYSAKHLPLFMWNISGILFCLWMLQVKLL